MVHRRVLLTGGTGLIGSEILHRLLAWTDDVEVHVAVRAPSEVHAAHRVRHLVSGLFAGRQVDDLIAGRVRPLRVDLAAPGLGLSAETAAALREGITDVVHSAASVRMDLPLEALRAANVEATRHLLDFLCDAPRLARFHHVSTIGVAGRLTGLLPEAPLPTDSFNNDYERSKWEAEALVLARAESVPVSVHRLSQVFGDSQTGWTPHFRMAYLFARLVASGVLPLLPARPGVMVDAVTSDYAADALFALVLGAQPESGAIFHEVAGREAITVHAWVEGILHRVGDLLREHGLALPSVELVEPEVFDRWRRDVGDRDPTRAALLTQIDGLRPHLTLAPRLFDDTRTLAALAPMGVVKRVPFDNAAIDGYAIRSHWGLKPEPRPLLGQPVWVRAGPRGTPQVK